ncbi:MAG: SDR family oxidoreductase [Magnetococcales bacterium]|nr:SDR family oxidoreductase [Magnetococcales bacterium]
MKLREAPVLVTGGGRRIGAACVLGLAEAGAKVVIHHGRSEREAESLCRQIQAQGGEAATVGADLSQPQQVLALMEQACSFFGPLHLLVNSAAIFNPGLFQDSDLSQWQAHLDINLTAPFILMQRFYRQLPPDQSGHIINFIDQRISRPRPGHVAYTTAKSALWTLTQMAALEMAPRIQVNAIAPGPILPAPDQSPEAFASIAKATPLARPGSPADIVRALIFLLEQPYITGEMIRVDGGEHL